MKKILLLSLIVLFCLPSNLLAQSDDPVRLQTSDMGAFVVKVPAGWVVEGSREELALASSELALFLLENSAAPIVSLPEGEMVISVALMDPQVLISTFHLPRSASPVELLDGLAFWMEPFITLKAAEPFELEDRVAAISRNLEEDQAVDVLLYQLFPDRIVVVTIISSGDIPADIYDIINSIQYRRQANIYEDDNFIADIPSDWDIKVVDGVHTISNIIEKAARSNFDLAPGEYIFKVIDLTPADEQGDPVDLVAAALELAGDDVEISDVKTFRLPGDLVPVEGRTFAQVVITSDTDDDRGVIVTQNTRQQTIALVYTAENGEGESIAWTAIWTALTVRFK